MCCVLDHPNQRTAEKEFFVEAPTNTLPGCQGAGLGTIKCFVVVQKV